MDKSSLNSVPADWERFFYASTLKKGRDIQRLGKVLKSEPAVDYVGIAAEVEGSQRDPYVLDIEWGYNEKGVSFIEGECSCPVTFNCKHVVAAISAFLNAGRLAKAEPPKPRISDQLQNWLTQLQQAATPPAPKPEVETGEEPQRLAYILNLEKPIYGMLIQERPRLTVSMQVVSKLAKGGYGQGRNFYYQNIFHDPESSAFVRAADVAIVRRLKLIQPGGYNPGGDFLTGTEGAALLEEMLRTGRCHWRGTGKKHPVLALGLPRLAKLEWQADQQGMQSPGLDVTPRATFVLPLVPPWYLDEAAGSCGALDTGLPPAVAHAWFNAPTLKPDQAEVLGEELVRRYPDLQVPAPRRIEIETVTDLKPVPCLRLFSHSVSQQSYGFHYGRSRGAETLELNLAHLEFDYEGQRVLPLSPGNLIEQFSDGKLRRIQRNHKSEKANYGLLCECGFQAAESLFYNYRLGKHATDFALPDANTWFAFCQNILPQFRADGWQVETDPSFQFRLAEPESWYADAEQGSGIDWFGVEIGVHLDGQKINLLPILLEQLQFNPRLISEEALAAHKEDAVIPIQLPGGRLLAFPVRRLKEMLGVLLELFNPQALDRKGRLRLSKLRAAELSSVAGNSAEWRWLGGAELGELSRKLRDFSGIQAVAPSPNLRAVLRPYQQSGLDWLQFLREYSLGGILADDMGLGKTVQAIAHLLHERESGRAQHPSLVIAPTSLMTNWRQETERFAPGLKVLVLHGVDRKQHFEKLAEHDLIVTSYPLLPRDQDVLLAQPFHYVVLDEAQFIKNPKTQYAQIVCQLQAQYRVCLTGTPMENHLGELWSLFNFLLPGFLGDEVRFRKVFRNPIEKGQSEERRKILAHRIAPFMLRRRKEEVVKELPPKTEIIQKVELTGAQRDLYETIRLAMHAKVREEVANKGFSRAHIIILDALLKLRQVCCDPRLLKFDAAQKITESAKLQLLMDLLPEMISEGRRVLLFSQFTSMLALIEPELAKAKIPYVLLTGQTTDRATPIQNFQEGQVPLFLISLKAGGTGLNLTAADTVIHYDPWWNPAVENQATDRAHRIGQEKKVFVYKLITVGTVEEKILELQTRKRELVEGLLNEERPESVKLSSADLDVLFAPIG